MHTVPEGIYNPITTMGVSAMFTFQLDDTKRQTLPAPHCCNGSCRFFQVLVHSHFDLVSSILIQFAIRKVAQMAPDMISSVAILCTLKEIGTQAAFLFQVTWLIKTF